MPESPFADQPAEAQKRLSVSELTGIIKGLLEENIATVTVEGEISNYVHHSSGHRYFTLKDASSQIRCVMFKWQAGSLGFNPEEGIKVEAVGAVTVYERGGQYQLNVSRLNPLGRGELLARLEELKKKLAYEGVFDRKRPLPLYPSKVGVVTSPTGAAIRDIINVLERRAPHVQIILRPARVQGDSAAPDIVQGIRDINKHTDVDVMIVGRGGGSIEDLWCFNEESVAREIAGSRIPVVSAVGHEIDFTLSDFASDVRAPTPSAAAEIVVRDNGEVRQEIAAYTARMRQGVLGVVDEMSNRIENVRRGLRPQRFLDQIAMNSQAVDELILRMKSILAIGLSEHDTKLERLKSTLLAMNPHAVLDRGYSIVYRTSDNRVVTEQTMVDAGDRVHIKLSKGSLEATIEE